MRRLLLSSCLLLGLAGATLPSTAMAGSVSKAKSSLKKAERAWSAGDFEAVKRHADEGLAEHYLADLRFWKARALWSLGKHEQAWQLMNSFTPGDLGRSTQNLFAAEYERMEREIKQARAASKRVQEMKQSLAKHRDTEELRGTVSNVFWIGAAAGVVLGGGLLAYGLMSHGDAANDDDKSTALYLASAGALVAGGGGGFAIAALVISPSGPVMKTALRPAAPSTVPVLTWGVRF